MMVWMPFLKVYQSNNAHRSLDNAIAIETAYKKKLAEEEEEDDDDEEDEDDDEEEEED